MQPGYEVESLPLLLEGDFDTGGSIRNHTGDFQVEERPLYEIDGEGPHLYFEVHKTNVTTDEAVRILEEQLEVPDHLEIGYAGRKDKNAVTTQRMSLEHATPGELEDFSHERITLEVLGYHRNKLQPGHLAGNTFTVKIRDFDETLSPERVNDRQKTLAETGVPNYFGPQRFGLRKDTSRLGECLVKNELDEFVELYFGRPSGNEPDRCRKARELFDKERYEEAIDAWPRKYRNKRRGLAAWIDTGKPGPVLSAISKSRRQLFVSAYQSQFFNELLADRLPEIDRVFEGDIARKTDTGGLFEVEDPEEEQPRATEFDISPTGLLPGGDPWYANGEPGQSEKALLSRHELSEEDFDRVGYLRSDGDRRPFRFRIEGSLPEFDEDENGPFLKLRFWIPSGCYATIFLREILGFMPE